MDSQEPPSKLRQRSVGPDKRQSEATPTPPTPILSESEPAIWRLGQPPTRTLFYIAALSVTTSLVLWFWRQTTWRDTLTRFPENYALCSRSGAQVYTVDEANPHVRCFAVHDSRFIAVGTLGMSRSLWFESKVVR